MTRSEIAKAMLDSGLLSDIADELLEECFSDFVEATRSTDTNPELAHAAARRRTAVSDVISRIQMRAMETSRNA